jgi:hypothetical protein
VKHRRSKLKHRYGRARKALPGSAAYVGQLAYGVNKTMELIRRAEAGDTRALATLRRRMKYIDKTWKGAK